MKLNKNQQDMFWAKWRDICALTQWGHEVAETERHALLRRAGFSSLRDVDHLEGFDRVLAQLLALEKPDSVGDQMRQQDQPKIRLKHAIGKLSPGNNYLKAVMRNKFGTDDWDDLSIKQLTDLRNTLAARNATAQRKRKKMLELFGHGDAFKLTEDQKAQLDQALRKPRSSPASRDDEAQTSHTALLTRLAQSINPDGEDAIGLDPF